jgi:hypothetical protein
MEYYELRLRLATEPFGHASEINNLLYPQTRRCGYRELAGTMAIFGPSVDVPILIIYPF